MSSANMKPQVNKKILSLSQLEKIQSSITQKNMVMGSAIHRVVSDLIRLRKAASKVVAESDPKEFYIRKLKELLDE